MADSPLEDKRRVMPDSEVPRPDANSTSASRYDVGAVETATSETSEVLAERAHQMEPPKAPEKKVAIFVAHGMGQQIPFQTLDQVAEGLRCASGSSAGRSEVRAIKFDNQWLHRIEMDLEDTNAQPVKVHIYESYWAPLTEGKISARGVVDFLRGAGRNGIKNGSRDFHRWLFGAYRRFDSPIRIVMYLLIALATVAALMVMNSTIALVAAARALLASPPNWFSDGLFLDLTTTFNAVVTIMAVFGASLGLAYGLRRLRAPAWLRQVWGWLTVLLFISVLSVIALAGLSLALLFYGHVKWKGAETRQLWHQVFEPGALDMFNEVFNVSALWLVTAAGGLFLLLWVFRITQGIVLDLLHSKGRWLTLLTTACVATLVFLAVRLGLEFREIFRDLGGNETLEVVRSGLAWPLLVAASTFIRRVLVQYVGDVAIYVAPYKLDGFFQLRDQIKDCVLKVATAVYAQKRPNGSPEYDQVFVVGHSLGSVIVYDVLNRLVNEDEASGGSLDVVARTPLLLTFGSPLDKTAFLFAIQRQHTDQAREALAASVQPLIRDYKFRPKEWLNIYSPWDIISGSLGFYDLEKSTDPRCIQNEVDPDATTLLAAHVEYWSNPLLFKRLYEAL